MASLEVGFSHDMFVELATETKNLVLFTERGQVLNSLFFFLQLPFFKVFSSVWNEMLSHRKNKLRY